LPVTSRLGQLTSQINRLFERATPFLLLAIVALGGFLRFHQIGSKGLWLDESFSVWLGWQPVGRMLAWLINIDQHPPLYYTLLHWWMLLGDSAATVRAFSALCGTLTIPVVYLLGRRLANHAHLPPRTGGSEGRDAPPGRAEGVSIPPLAGGLRGGNTGSAVGLLAALLLAVSPFHVRFAQETRMYTLLTLNAALALYAMVRLLTDPRAAQVSLGQQLVDLWQTWRAARNAEQQALPDSRVYSPAAAGYERDFRTTTDWVSAPTRRRWLPLRDIETDLAWLGYMVFTAGTLLSHNTAIFFPIATNLFMLGYILLRTLTLPIANRKSQITNYELRITNYALLRNWLLAQAGVFLLWSPWLVAFVLQSMGVYREFWIPSPTWQTVVDTVKTFLSSFLPPGVRWPAVVWGLYWVLAALGLLYFRRRPAILALLFILFLTPFAGEWLVSLRRPIFYDRTLIWTTIPLYLVLAAGIGQLRYRPYIIAAALMVLTVNGLSLREYYAHFEKEQWDDAAAFVAQRVQPDDLLLFNATWVQIPFDFYFRLHNRPVAEHGLPVDLFDRGILEPKMAESDLPRLRSLIRGHNRVWLIYSHDWYTDPQGLIPPALDEELGPLDTWDFYGLQLRLYGVQ